MDQHVIEIASPQERKPRSRHRFEHKRERILVAATDLINEHGAKGTTLLDVATAVGLNTTSVTYYFRRKDQLAAAVFERTLGRLEEIVAEAGKADTPQERVARFIAANVELRSAVTRGTGLPLAKLSDMRTLDDPVREPLEKHFQAIFRQVRAYFGPLGNAQHKALLTARTHMLMEAAFWLPVWISQYSLVDFPRVQAELIDILTNGIAKPDAPWDPRIIDLEEEEVRGGTEGPESFLRVATRLINEAGYRGASVVRIADELNVTKGSFYHHLDAKDDLVLECFRRSYQRYSRILTLVAQNEPSGWRRIETAMATLLNIQFFASWPLLRTSALQALPAPLRAEVVARANRTALRFSGALIDGMKDGSVRIVDPLIASQVITATINTAFDLRSWASKQSPDTAIAYYASSLVEGLFNDRIAQAAPR
ncbi:MAG: TetR/AcrR family transcriptional regulator [Novosphingobium sp.]